MGVRGDPGVSPRLLAVNDPFRSPGHLVALAAVWPRLEWSKASYHHGALHHVAVLGKSAVIRVAFNVCSQPSGASRLHLSL